jgi:hypothetical protein
MEEEGRRGERHGQAGIAPDYPILPISKKNQSKRTFIIKAIKINQFPHFHNQSAFQQNTHQGLKFRQKQRILRFYACFRVSKNRIFVKNSYLPNKLSYLT